LVRSQSLLLSLVAGGEDLTLLAEVKQRAAEVIRGAATDDTNIIFGATLWTRGRFNGQVWV